MPDDTSPALLNVALLIDADNSSADRLEPVLTVLAELGTVNIRRAYGNWQKPTLKQWASIIHLHAIETQQQFDVIKGKSATDMKLIIDAMDPLYGGRVTGFGIMSSDSDFTPPATPIRQDGIPVYGFGEAKTPQAFQKACTRFIDVTALPAAGEVASTDMRSVPRGARETGGAETPDDATTQTSPGRSSQGSTQLHRPIDADVIKVLGDAYRAVERDENGYAAVKDVGMRAGNMSSFDARNYGFHNVAELLENLPDFHVVRAPNEQLRVKRVN